MEILGVTAITDSVVDQALSSYGDPKISFTSSAPIVKGSVSIISADGSISYCTQELLNPTSPITMSDCTLSNGTFKISLRGTSADGSSAVHTITFEKNVMNSLPSPLLALTGEQLNLTPTTGFPAFTAQDAGSGYLTINSLLYNIPLTANNGSETVQIKDRFGQSANQVINMRKFSEVFSLTGAVTSSGFQNILSMVQVGTDLFALAYTMNAGFTNKPYQFNLLKSTDGGTSWSKVSTASIPGAEETLSAFSMLYHNAGVFYILGAIKDGAGLKNWYLGKSIDNGISWQLVQTYRYKTSDTTAANLIFTNDNHYLLGGHAKTYTPALSAIIVKRCSVATDVCTDSETIETSLNDYQGLIEFQKDLAGNLYYLSVTAITSMTTEMTFKKSTDNGITWITLHSSGIATATASDYFKTFSVSEDGTRMVAGGGATTSFIYYSNNSGATFSYSNPCTNGWQVLDTEIVPNKDIVLTCWGFNSGYQYRTSAFNTANTKVNESTNSSYSILFKMNSGTIIQYEHNGGSMIRSTSNSAATFTALTYPTVPTVPIDTLLLSLASVNATTAYAVGYTFVSSSNTNGLIYKTTNSGTTWSLDYTWNDVATTFFADLDRVPNSTTLYAGGIKSGDIWQVYKNSDGMNWVSSDLFNHPTGTFLGLYDIFSTSDNRVYSVGSYYDSALFRLRAYARISTDGGATWNQFDDYALAASNSNVYSSGVAIGGDVWLSGYSTTAAAVKKWMIRRYNGSTWTTEDESDFGGVTSGAYAKQIFKASDGSLYAIGEYYETVSSDSRRHWVVKKRNANGTWSVIDDYIFNGDSWATPNKMTEVDGILYVAGSAYFGSKGIVGLIRMYKNGRWYNVDAKTDMGRGQYMTIEPCFTQSLCGAGNTLTTGPSFRSFITKINLF